MKVCKINPFLQDDDSPLLELFTVDVSDTENSAADRGGNKMTPKSPTPNLVKEVFAFLHL